MQRATTRAIADLCVFRLAVFPSFSEVVLLQSTLKNTRYSVRLSGSLLLRNVSANRPIHALECRSDPSSPALSDSRRLRQATQAYLVPPLTSILTVISGLSPEQNPVKDTTTTSVVCTYGVLRCLMKPDGHLSVSSPSETSKQATLTGQPD